jgi:hypothetical protein
MSGKRIRVGHLAGATICWREDNFKPHQGSGKTVGVVSGFLPNIGYASVP